MDAWKIDDKAWRKARRDEWNIIKDKIKKTTINRKMVKYLKQYFMDGVVSDEKGKPEYFYTFYKMWLHPIQTEDQLKKLFDAIDNVGDYEYCFKYFKEFGVNTKLKLGEDGLLNRNEALFVKVLYPKSYSDEKISFNEGSSKRCKTHPESFFSSFCVMGSYLLLDETYYENEYRQFMVDFWFSVFPYGDLTRPEIDWLFRAVYYFDEVGIDDGPEGNRRRFAERMKEALDARELPEPLAEKWAFIKTPEGKIPTEGEAGLFKGWSSYSKSV